MALKNKVLDIQANVLSSNIKKLYYLPETEKLHITFKDDSIYEYDNVENGKFIDMLLSDSLGKYFHTNIKSKYGCRKLSGVEMEMTPQKEEEKKSIVRKRNDKA